MFYTCLDLKLTKFWHPLYCCYYSIFGLGDILLMLNNDQKWKKQLIKCVFEKLMTMTLDVAKKKNLEIEEISLFLSKCLFDKGEKLFKKCSACHTYKKIVQTKLVRIYGI